MPNLAKCLLEMSTLALEYFWAYFNFTHISVAYLPLLTSENAEKIPNAEWTWLRHDMVVEFQSDDSFS